MAQKIYGIWCHDKKDWLRNDGVNQDSVVAYFSASVARRAAAKEYGFKSYSEVVKNDWATVKPLKG